MSGRELVTVTGGLRARANASWPLVTLEVNHDSIKLGPTWRALGFFVPVYSSRIADIRSIELVRGVMGSRGIKFVFGRDVQARHRWGWGLLWPKSRQSVIFWTRRADLERVVEALPRELIRTNLRRIWLG